MQRLSRDNVRRIFEEHEKLNHELETKQKKLDSWSKQLNKREALTERERQKLDEDKKQVMYANVAFPNNKFFSLNKNFYQSISLAYMSVINLSSFRHIGMIGAKLVWVIIPCWNYGPTLRFSLPIYAWSTFTFIVMVHSLLSFISTSLYISLLPQVSFSLN